MKIISQSQAPQKHTYIHLAYISAQQGIETVVNTVMQVTLFSLFLVSFLNAWKLKPSKMIGAKVSIRRICWMLTGAIALGVLLARLINSL